MADARGLLLGAEARAAGPGGQAAVARATGGLGGEEPIDDAHLVVLRGRVEIRNNIAMRRNDYGEVTTRGRYHCC